MGQAELMAKLVQRDAMKIVDALACPRVVLNGAAVGIEFHCGIENGVRLEHLIAVIIMIKRYRQDIGTETLPVKRARKKDGVNAIALHPCSTVSAPTEMHRIDLLIPE